MWEPTIASLVLALTFVSGAIAFRLKGRRRTATDVSAPILSTTIENPVLIIHGHAQLVQGGGVVFDTRQGHHPMEEVVDRPIGWEPHQ